MRWLNIVAIVRNLGELGKHLGLGNTDTVEAGKTIVCRRKTIKGFRANVSNRYTG